MLKKQMPKQEFLADLQARNRYNRQVVETVFVPLNKAQRSWQPEPGEWSMDQCFQHLIIAFEWLSLNFIPALNKPEPPDSDGIFRHSLLASLTMEKQFDPKRKGKTVKANNPTAVYKAEVLTQWLDQQARLGVMIEQARDANLQTMCRVLKWLPIRYNLGDYLRFYVSHDELHIDQAQRVLAAYEQQAGVQPLKA
ncbi:MAG: DinB family protein [Ardenticatenaceae bacterium]|nr:DinB family protein [Ardenticatenaceae bacterium]